VTDRERAVAFLRETYRRRVERVEAYPWGELVLTPSLPRVYDANFAIVDRWDGDVVELRNEMDRVQDEHDFEHRKVVVLDEELATRLWPGIEQLDWPLRHRSLLMVHSRVPDRPADASIEVVAVGEVDWAQGRRALELEVYVSDPEVVRQLLDLDRRLAAAMDVRHLAARVDGEIASYAGLYLDDGVAQVEDVATLPAYRRQGLASAIVLRAVAEARRGGAELVFLMADESDSPKDLYGRLGFDPIGAEHVFGRPAPRDS
jgi:GNAT superfamily N-acetyltransferase